MADPVKTLKDLIPDKPHEHGQGITNNTVILETLPVLQFLVERSVDRQWATGDMAGDMELLSATQLNRLLQGFELLGQTLDIAQGALLELLLERSLAVAQAHGKHLCPEHAVIYLLSIERPG